MRKARRVFGCGGRSTGARGVELVAQASSSGRAGGARADPELFMFVVLPGSTQMPTSDSGKRGTTTVRFCGSPALSVGPS